jgi:hypothetical protein
MVGRGAKPLGPEALARAIGHRRWRAVHARRSRPGVSDRRQPGRGEKEREPERVHRSSVPATRRAMKASSPSFSKMLTFRLGIATLVATLVSCSQHERRTRGGRSGDSTGGARPGRGHLSGLGFSFSSQVLDLRPALGFRDLIRTADSTPTSILSFTVALELPAAGSRLRVWPIRPAQLDEASRTRGGSERLTDYRPTPSCASESRT